MVLRWYRLWLDRPQRQAGERRSAMVTCSACGKQIPADEMAGVRGMRGIEEHKPDIFAALSLAHAVNKARKCDTCGEWICNECARSAGTFVIEHGNCGGMFEAI